MKKANGILIFLLSVMLCMTLAMCQSAYADPISPGDIIKFVDGPGSPGGEFGIKKKIGDTYMGVLFVTFCVEYNEYMNFSNDFRVVNISDRAINGGIGPAGDPIDPKTAWLYTQFRNNTLGYTGDAASADSLQRAIWFTEMELGNTNLNNPTSYLDGMALTWYQQALAAGWTDIGNVRVMNLTFLNGTLAQDQLVLVPEPSTLLLLGAGLLGLGILGRRKFRTKP